MSKTKHTSGEWEEEQTAVFLTDEDGHNIECIQINSGATEIGFISFDHVTLEEGNANVKLFKAAPKLLEALQNIENDDGSIPNQIWNMRNEAIKQATS